MDQKASPTSQRGIRERRIGIVQGTRAFVAAVALARGLNDARSVVAGVDCMKARQSAPEGLRDPPAGICPDFECKFLAVWIRWECRLGYQPPPAARRCRRCRKQHGNSRTAGTHRIV